MESTNIGMANFDNVYETYPTAVPKQPWPGQGEGLGTPVPGPVCKPADGCFKASHVVPGGPFLINTFLAQPDRRYIPAGAIPIREGTLCKNS